MKNIFKRTVSAILSLVIVISACSGIISTFATGSNSGTLTLQTEKNGVTDLPTGTSIVKSAKAYYKGVNATNKSETTIAFDQGSSSKTAVEELTDGVVESTIGLKVDGTFAEGTSSKTTKIHVNDGEVYSEIVYALDGLCNIDNIIVVGHSAERWRISYEIYVGNDETTLFDGAPKIKYDNTVQNKRTQIYKGNGLSGKFAALRITAMSYTDNVDDYIINSGWMYTRICQFAVLGTVDMTVRAPQDTNDVDFPASPSRPVVKSVSAKYNNGTDTTAATIDSGELLYNGNAVGAATVSVANSPYVNDAKNYVDFTVSLKGKQDISDIFIAHSDEADYIPREYAIYIGDDKDTLFTGNPYYTYSSDNPKAVQHYSLDGWQGSFVGMRVIKPHKDTISGTDSLVTLREFNVYTKKAVSLNLESSTNDVTGLPQGDSVVKSYEVYYKAPTASQKVSSSIDIDSGSSDKTMLELLTDGSATVGLKVNGSFAEKNDNNQDIKKLHVNEDAYVDIVYTLDGICNVNNIVVIGKEGDWQDKDKWKLSYKLYAGNDKDTIFDGDPIAVVDNTTDASPKLTQIFSSEELSAKYVAMRITAVTLSNDLDRYNHAYYLMYARINEFNVMGTVDMTFRAPQNSDEIELPSDPARPVIKSATAKYSNGTDSSDAEIVSASKLNNGNLTDGLATVNLSDSPYKNETENYVDFTFKLKGQQKVRNIYIAHSDEADYIPREYELYISDSKDTLFSGKPYYTYSSDSPKAVQLYTLEDCLANFVGLRVIKPHKDSVSGDASKIRLREFNVYTNEPLENLKLVTSKNDVLDLPQGESVILNAEVYYKAPDSSERVASNISIDSGSSKKTMLELLTDGSLSVGLRAGGTFAEKIGGDGDDKDNIKKIHVNEDAYVDIVYTLDGKCSINNIVVIGKEGDWQDKDKWKLSYKLYAGDDKETLFSGDPIAVVDNTTDPAPKLTQIFSSEELSAKYVAMRITAATTSNDLARYNHLAYLLYPRLSEFNVIGVVDMDARAPKNADSVDFPASPARPIVKSATAKYTNGTESSEAEIENASNLYDGALSKTATINLSDSPYINETNNYVDVVLKLSGQQQINDIYVAHSDEADYIPREYILYVGNDEETLFNRPYYTYSNNSPKAIQHYEVDGRSARFVGMRIIKPHKDTITGSDSQVRLREFSVYTDKAKTTISQVKNDDTVTDIPTGETIVKSVDVYYKSPKESVRIPSSINLDGGHTSDKTPLEELTDGEYDKWLMAGSTFALVGPENVAEEIHLNDGVAYTDIIYTLDGVCDVENIIFVGRSEDKWSTSYKLYVGNDKKTIFDNPPIYTYDNATKRTRTQVYTCEEVSAKYVAMRITGVTATDNVADYAGTNANYLYARFNQFNVLGTVDMEARAPQNEDSVAIPSGKSIVKSATAYYYNGTKRKEVTLNNGNKLFDGSLSGVATTTSAEAPMNVKGRYTDIVLEMEGEGIVTDIYVANADNSDYYAREYEIYIGADKDKLFTKPYYTYKTKYPKRIQSFKIDSYVARYVGIRIKQAHDDSVDTSESFVRLAEFNVFGTIELFVPSKGDAGAIIPEGNNFLKGMAATTKFVNTKDSTKNHSNVGDVTGITDGDVTVQHMGAGARGFAKLENKKPVVTKDGSIYAEYTFVLEGTAKVEKFYFCGGASLATQTGAFEIYVSNKAETLYDEPLVKVDNTTTCYRAHLLELNIPIENVRYIGLRITNPINTDNYKDGTMALNKDNENTHNIYPRINEFAVFGEFKEDVWEFKQVTEVATYNMPKGIKLDGLKNLTHSDTTIEPVIKAYDVESNTAKKITSSYITSDKSSLTHISDGNPTTALDINRPVFAEAQESGAVIDYTENKSRYVDVYYDLRSMADISHIVLGFPSNPALVMGNYEIYIADTKGELFSGKPYVTVDNATQYRTTGTGDKMNIISFNKDDKVADTARFIGLRIYNPISEKLGDSATTTVKYGAYNAVHVRITEFAVYGNYVDKKYDPTTYEPDFIPTKKIDLANIEKIYGKNILKPENFYIYSDGQGDSVAEIAKLRNQFATEVLSRTGKDFLLPQANMPASGYTKPGKVVDLVVRLDEGDLTEVHGFIFQSTYNESEYMCSSYEVYVAEEREDLFTSEPIFVYNEDRYEITNGQVVVLPKNKRVKGCWFAIRVLNPVYTATIENNLYLRASVMFAWGKGAKVKAFPSNIAENMPCDVTLISGTERTKVSDENLTIKEQKQLTDCVVTTSKNGDKKYTSLTDTYADIETNGKDLELVYNLCGDIDVSKISVNALIDGKHGFKTLKVYSSDILGGVFDEKNLLFTAKVNGKTGKITLQNKFKTAKRMRYVRLLLEDTKDVVRIYTIDVIGPDTQKMATKNITSTVASTDYTMLKNDIIAGTSDEFMVYPTLLNDLTDGNDVTFFSITEGLIGQHTYDMTLYLGDLRTISNIQLKYLKQYKQTWPIKINIYIGETEEEAKTKTEPDLVANHSDIKNATLSLDIKPRLARYVRFEFAEFQKVNYYVDPETGKDIITTTLADLKISGTRVTGIQTDEDNENLLTFKDDKVGVSLSLKRIDINDIYTTAVGIRVTPENATNWQMKSLYNNPYFKIIDKKIYKIELLDINGNTVTDVGGREVTISVKTPEGYEGRTMFGNASKRTSVSLIDSTEENGIVTAKYEFTEGDNKIAILGMVSETDPYWATIGELEDFEEGTMEDLMGERDPSWYNSIHTTDSRFTVTPLISTLEAGISFTATDVSQTIADSEYYNVLMLSPYKKVAAFYDMALTQNGLPVAEGNAYEVSMVIPASIRDYYSNFEVYYSDGFGTVTPLYVEELDGVLTFQTMSLGNIAILGDMASTDNTVPGGIVDNGYGDNGYVDNVTPDGSTETVDPSSPITGESRQNAAAVIMLLTAAAFVVVLTAKKSAKNK